MSALPEWVDPRRLAAANGVVDGEIAVTALSRVTPELQSECNAEVVAVQLSFAEDGQRRVLVTGRIQARLQLQCQRCLGPADWPVDVSVRAIVAADENAAAALPRDWEPLMQDERGGLSPALLVEDELLLAMPLVARCDREACRQEYEQQHLKDAGTARTDNPFAVLGELKRGR